MVHQKINLDRLSPEEALITPTYASRALTSAVPKYEIPEGEMPPAVAYNLIRDELALDGNSRLNLATFVTTWMEPEAKQLMAETFDKNMIDKDEYPQTAEIELRCVNMIARLWNAPESEAATGCSTIGSSEAAMLGGMALKWQWRKRRQKEGKPTDKPNLVMGINVQVCWEKFSRYWEVEPRFVPMEGSRFHLNATEAIKLIDENTIGVIAIMGSTFDGSYEPVQEINDALEKLNRETGWQVPLHVDGASGGFIAPFLDPDLVWDFRLKWVKSINASGHKYGLVYPGVGWIIWRDRQELPEELIFHCNYLGGDLPNFALNFSRPGNQVVAQYYNFLRLGKEGYRQIHQACRDTALYLSGEIAKMGPFELITDGSTIPVFAWKLKETISDQSNYSLFDLADKLRERGWLVPAYTMPKNRQDLTVQRVVIKEGFSRDMAALLLRDIHSAIAFFQSQSNYQSKLSGSHFHH
ncbi:MULTISPECIES: glutamate decarboxylase [Microcystis]|uniref:Glutamate decarboxylase n=1 Tax=Microcystis panniformis FACHB-1757 TaxID=1638788 RepID=A0A0K1S3E1_9CHRO|nr:MULTISPECIES: glutamate decarboxylase [Microcystis]AKV68652.1 Glutamate decarboxylase [Microcystis panniformis FACHB-1757]TRT76678.1 MAG: glutamate decarboxylase [Microcystis sp. M_OC_Ca_00000000_S217Cul]TRT92915.1 MAG: glutamate decarboxylase [Microcystis sp. M_OC_Ca_00000000_C217Col]